MTIRELRREHPGLFYPQDWYLAEDFMDEELPDNCPDTPPVSVAYDGIPPEFLHTVFDRDDMPPAVVLAHLYCLHPYAPIWRARYLWTGSLDHLGQRVYVGDNGNGLEIHRHLHITPRFGVATW